MADQGGIRIGAGRPLGSRNRATADIKVGLSGLAKTHTEAALEVIVELMRNSLNDNVRLAAATAILDRGYGRPTKTTSLEVNAPFVPTTIELVAYTGAASVTG